MIVLKTLHREVRQRVQRGCIDLLAKKFKKQNLIVSVEKCTCFCIDGRQEKCTAKSERGFLKCKKETCTIVCSRRKVSAWTLRVKRMKTLSITRLNKLNRECRLTEVRFKKRVTMANKVCQNSLLSDKNETLLFLLKNLVKVK